MKEYLQKISAKQHHYSKGEKPHSLGDTKGPTAGRHATSNSWQWPGATRAQPLCCRCQVHTGVSHVSAAMTRLPWNPGPLWAGACTMLGSAAAWSRLLLAKESMQLSPRLSCPPSNTCTQSKKQTGSRRTCVLATCWKAMPFPRALQPFLPHMATTSLRCCVSAYIFPKRKERQDNHLHRLNTTPGLSHQHPS